MLVRSRKQLAAVVARDPLGKVAKNRSRYLVTFLRSKPPAKVVRELAAEDVAPEQFVIEGREVYAWHPDGVQRSKLNKLLAQRLDVTATARNWNTVTKLLELAAVEGARLTAPARARRPGAWSARTPRAAAPRSAPRRRRRS